MDHLWTPWRYAYMTSAESSSRPGVADALSAWPGDTGCVFCNLIASVDYAIANGMAPEDAERAAGLISAEALFPLSECVSVHLRPRDGDALRAPRPPCRAAPEAAHELIDLAQRTERALEAVYSPKVSTSV